MHNCTILKQTALFKFLSEDYFCFLYSSPLRRWCSFSSLCPRHSRMAHYVHITIIPASQMRSVLHSDDKTSKSCLGGCSDCMSLQALCTLWTDRHMCNVHYMFILPLLDCCNIMGIISILLPVIDSCKNIMSYFSIWLIWLGSSCILPSVSFFILFFAWLSVLLVLYTELTSAGVTLSIIYTYCACDLCQLYLSLLLSADFFKLLGYIIM